MSGDETTGTSDLRTAIEEDRVDEAARLFGEGERVDWDVERCCDLPLLHLTCERGDVDMLRLLLAHGAVTAIDHFDDCARSPLMLASASGHVEVMDELLRHGARLNAVDEQHGGDTALLEAIAACQPAAVATLVNAGANPGITGARGRTACELSRDIAAERRDALSRAIVEIVHTSPLHGWDDCRSFPDGG